MANTLPETGFLRLRQILGDCKARPVIPALIPVSRSTWWAGVRSGRFPIPVKLGERITAWRVEDIHALLTHIARGEKPAFPEHHDADAGGDA